MTESAANQKETRCSYCGGDGIIKVGMDYVCTECGLVVYSNPFKSTWQNSRTPNQTRFGKKRDLQKLAGRQREKFSRLGKRQRQFANDRSDVIVWRAKQILNRIISSMEYPDDELYKTEIIKKFKFIFNTNKGAHFRNPNLLIPVLTYLLYYSRKIVRDRDLLYECSDLTEDSYFNLIGILAKHNYLKDLKRFDIRDEMFIFLCRFKEKFTLSTDFLNDVQWLMKKKWALFTGPVINGRPNHIAALIAYTTAYYRMRKLSVKQFCDFFGIAYTTLQTKFRYLLKYYGLRNIDGLRVRRGDLSTRNLLHHFILYVRKPRSADANKRFICGHNSAFEKSSQVLLPNVFFPNSDILSHIEQLAHVSFSPLIITDLNSIVELTGKDPPFI